MYCSAWQYSLQYVCCTLSATFMSSIPIVILVFLCLILLNVKDAKHEHRHSMSVCLPVCLFHLQVLDSQERTFLQWCHAVFNILFVVGCKAHLSHLLPCWYWNSLWLAAGQNDTHWYPTLLTLLWFSYICTNTSALKCVFFKSGIQWI